MLTVARRRARAIALIAVAAPPLFVFLGVESMLHIPVPDIWLWIALWLAMIALVAFAGGGDAATPTAPVVAPARLAFSRSPMA